MNASRPRDFSLTVALCASLVVHGLLLMRAAEVYSLYMSGHMHLPGFETQSKPSHLVVAQDIPDPWQRLGDSTGTGSAIADSPGEQTLAAPKAGQDQPFLSLDAAGPGNVGDDPSDSLLPKGAARPPVAEAEESAEQPGVPTPFGIASPPGDLAIPLAPRTQTAQPGGAPAQAAVADATPPGADSAADPAPAGRLESDPTTVTGGVEFRQGGTKVQLGRAAKITRPRLTLAARSDLFSGAGPMIVLKIRTDATGNVVRAEVFRSSGSANVDQPCKLAAYNWWFEPPKDPQGQPVEDVFLFSIRFI